VATAAASGDGAANAVTFITGTTTTKLLWPESSIPSTFTVCSVTRYTGGSRGRIFDCANSPSQSANWLHGHYSSSRGRAHYGDAGGWQSSGWYNGAVDDWLVMCGTIAGAAPPGNFIVDQNEIGTDDDGTGSCRLNIGYNEPSDWAVHSLFIWDYSLGTVPTLWRTSATLLQVLFTWLVPWCDSGMRGTVVPGQGGWGRRYS
jgi:hypothetical protein